MQLSGLSFTSAPQVMGQTRGLPAVEDKTVDVQKIKPILDARQPETQLGSPQPPSSFWNTAQGKPDPRNHNAPPSIMQIKISQMLNDQATEHAAGQPDETTEDKPEEAVAATGAPRPAPEAAKANASEHAILPFPNREPEKGEETALMLPQMPEPPSRPAPREIEVKEARPSQAQAGYGDAASMSRKDVFSTLP